MQLDTFFAKNTKMTFLKRLRFFLIGAGIGSIIVWVMLGQRAEKMQCSYFPNDRVLYDLAKKDMSFSEKAECQFACLNNDSTAIDDVLKSGDVDYKRSETEMEKCKTYYIDTEHKGKSLTGVFYTCDSTMVLTEFELPLTLDCNCD